MKAIFRIFLVALIAGILFSCSSPINNVDQESLSDFKMKDTTIPFAGSWITKDYIDSLKVSGSPKIAQGTSQFIVIPERTLEKTMMVWNFHEGSPALTILKNKDYELWEMQNESLFQQYGEIKVVNDSTIEIAKRIYVKINPVVKENDRLILEDVLFEGIYMDSVGNNVELKKDGQVQGLANYKIYKPVIDYIGPGMYFDQIGFGTKENDLEYFGFEFNKDTLKLYIVDCLRFDKDNNECLEVKPGMLRYKLVKKSSFVKATVDERKSNRKRKSDS